MASQRMSLLVLAVALAAALILSAEAQSSTPACAQQLVPCANYMNSTNPPDTCCNPIREAVATERECLCNLYNTPGLLQSLGINVTQALQLTRACGVNADTGLCNASALSPSSPSTPGGVPGNGDNDAGRMMWSGLPGLLLLWASMLLY
ncbi:lipid transfer-like protein VAS [Punica granatum]|uniref:Lipid transfer-like protein VAS n=1 Tax=Punica granatum TaxID=22663 RepID=A0A6P8DJB7_PUNGR|nr:lipid transfer-like protein VAS [Punica granatum]